MQGPFTSSFLSHGNFLFEEKKFLPVIGTHFHLGHSKKINLRTQT